MKKEVWGRRGIKAQRLPAKKSVENSPKKKFGRPKIKNTKQSQNNEAQTPVKSKNTVKPSNKRKTIRGKSPLIVLFTGENCLFCRRGVGESGSDGGVAFFGERLFVACHQRTTALAPETD